MVDTEVENFSAFIYEEGELRSRTWELLSTDLLVIVEGIIHVL